ncbi:MAG TPA: hypothetical protein VKU19_07545 [Bryobacteraceae bacterium]|nr:hypothetical protein [Bryobacteraceae bacterium]
MSNVSEQPTTKQSDNRQEITKPVRVDRANIAMAGKIRADLNLEKWPGIWQPSRSKNEKTLRILEREITEADASRVVSRVEIGYTHLGTLTTEERKMYGALIEVWEESGKPSDRPVFFSDRLLARILKKSWGSNVRDAIVKSLRKLRTVPIEWINSYYQKTDEGKTVLRERTPFTILSDLKIVEREVDGSVNRAVGYFQPDDRIVRNLLANFTKPLLLSVMVDLKSDIAVLLYPHIDLMLARKDSYERRSKELFADLGLTNAEYNRQYERYRALKKALAELEGVRLSTGVLKVAKIAKTVDGRDYKTVFRKVPAPAAEQLLDDGGVVTASSVVVNHYAKSKDPATSQAEEVVGLFHRLVHGLAEHEVLSKELGQALALISQHGLEKTKHIVEYAAGKATETNFKIQHFGAILSYASRGAADFETKSRSDTEARATPAPPARKPAEVARVPSRGEARLSILTEDQYAARFAACREELFREIPFLATQSQAGSKIEADLVRSRVVRQLETEAMELLPLLALELPVPVVQILRFAAP